MSQALLDLVNRFGGAGAVEAMAERVGLTPEQTQAAMAALMPAVAGGMARRAEEAGPAALDADAKPATEVVAGDGAASDNAVAHGTGLVGALFGGHEATTAVADHAAAATGLDVGKLKDLLPMVTTLVAAALGHAGNAATGGGVPHDGMGGMLGGLINEVTGRGGAGGAGAAATLSSMLDFNKDGSAMDDIMGIVGKLRGR